jgi:GNAT superfamily N-acetyltransferase
MMDTAVRRASTDDVVALTALEAEARAAAAELRGGPRLLADHPPVAAGWAEWVDAGARAAWVATIDDVAVGYLALELPASAGGAGLVTQVFVTPEARELGLGEALVAAALDVLVAVGAGALDAVALPGDRLTKNLFERAGVVSRLIVLTRSLDR